MSSPVLAGHSFVSKKKNSFNRNEWNEEEKLSLSLFHSVLLSFYKERKKEGRERLEEKEGSELDFWMYKKIGHFELLSLCSFTPSLSFSLPFYSILITQRKRRERGRRDEREFFFTHYSRRRRKNYPDQYQKKRITDFDRFMKVIFSFLLSLLPSLLRNDEEEREKMEKEERMREKREELDAHSSSTVKRLDSMEKNL